MLCEFRKAGGGGDSVPATIIPSRLVGVQKFIDKPPGIFARSSISSGDVTVICEVKSARPLIYVATTFLTFLHR